MYMYMYMYMYTVHVWYMYMSQSQYHYQSTPYNDSFSPGLGLLTVQVELVFICQLHDDHRVLGHAELGTANDGLLQERQVALSVTPTQVEAFQGESVPRGQLECTDN